MIQYTKLNGKDLAFFSVFGKQWAVWINKDYNEADFIKSIKHDLIKELTEELEKAA